MKNVTNGTNGTPAETLTPITIVSNDIAAVLSELTAKGLHPVVILSPNGQIPTSFMQPSRTVQGDASAPPATGNIQRFRRGRQGRTAGLYIAKRGTPPELSKGAMTNVLNALKAASKTEQKGMTARTISEELDMPLGTVGWALTQLIKQKAVEHQA